MCSQPIVPDAQLLRDPAHPLDGVACLLLVWWLLREAIGPLERGGLEAAAWKLRVGSVAIALSASRRQDLARLGGGVRD